MCEGELRFKGTFGFCLWSKRRGHWLYIRPLRLAMPCWWVLNRTKQLSMAATLRVPCCAHAWRLGQTVVMCSVPIAFRWYYGLHWQVDHRSEVDLVILFPCWSALIKCRCVFGWLVLRHNIYYLLRCTILLLLAKSTVLLWLANDHLFTVCIVTGLASGF